MLAAADPVADGRGRGVHHSVHGHREGAVLGEGSGPDTRVLPGPDGVEVARGELPAAAGRGAEPVGGGDGGRRRGDRHADRRTCRHVRGVVVRGEVVVPRLRHPRDGQTRHRETRRRPHDGHHVLAGRARAERDVARERIAVVVDAVAGDLHQPRALGRQRVVAVATDRGPSVARIVDLDHGLGVVSEAVAVEVLEPRHRLGVRVGVRIRVRIRVGVRIGIRVGVGIAATVATRSGRAEHGAGLGVDVDQELALLAASDEEGEGDQGVQGRAVHDSSIKGQARDEVGYQAST